MRKSDEEEIGTAGFLSDDSSFYGDEDTKARLEARAANFNPAPYWESHEHQFHVIAAKGQKEFEEKEKARVEAEEKEKARAKAEEERPASTTGSSLQGKVLTESQHQHELPTHRQTPSSSLRADESLEAFLVRLSPSTVCGEGPWIQIDGPSIGTAERSQGDRDTFIARGQEILKKLSLEPNAANSWGARETARADILSAARSLGLTSGKWIIFSPLESTDTLWSTVAAETLAGQLGHSSRVATAEAESEGGKRRIEVYTADVDDLGQIGGVLEILVNLIKSVGKMGQVGQLYYKPEAFSELGIQTGNEWGLRSSIHSRRSVETWMRESRAKDVETTGESD
ncbi:MAG: hypothetical protein LQ349_001825 [Xanthoria aureola]|nr:MAG: hypothetical protein LQ349_001825 [Xanthoria aureola]